MRFDADDFDPITPDRDPVVRMPKRMAEPVAPPPAISVRVVALAGVASALLGGMLGAVGIGIVVATVAPPPPPAALRPAVVVDAGPPPTFELRVDASVLPPPTQGAAEFEVVQQSIGRGRTLAAALRAVGVEPAVAPKVIRALRPLIPMRHLRPSDRVVALRDPASHSLGRVEFRRSATEVWAALRSTDDRWYGEAIRLVASQARVTAGFRVANDIESSIRAAGLYPEVVPLLAAALVALDLPPRLVGGDIVRVVIEEERLNDAHQRYGQLLALDLRGPRVRRRAFWSESARDWYDPEGFTAERGALRSPVVGARTGAGFQPNRRHPVSGARQPHLGLDLIAPAGTPVLAPRRASCGFAASTARRATSCACRTRAWASRRATRTWRASPRGFASARGCAPARPWATSAAPGAAARPTSTSPCGAAARSSTRPGCSPRATPSPRPCARRSQPSRRTWARPSIGCRSTGRRSWSRRRRPRAPRRRLAPSPSPTPKTTRERCSSEIASRPPRRARVPSIRTGIGTSLRALR
ncbi:MAG: hypothetical protein R3A48_12425 [Polyangiales bacterium]